MVKVLPEPVMPSSVWCGLPAAIPRERVSIALGWSPVGWYGQTSSKRPSRAVPLLCVFAASRPTPPILGRRFVEGIRSGRRGFARGFALHAGRAAAPRIADRDRQTAGLGHLDRLHAAEALLAQLDAVLEPHAQALDDLAVEAGLELGLLGLPLLVQARRADGLLQRLAEELRAQQHLRDRGDDLRSARAAEHHAGRVPAVAHDRGRHRGERPLARPD